MRNSVRWGGMFTHLNKPLPWLQGRCFPACGLLHFEMTRAVIPITLVLTTSLLLVPVYAFCCRLAVFKSL